MRLPESVGVVELSVNPHFDAALVAQGLTRAAAAVGKTLRATVVTSGFFRGVEDALRNPYELAEQLDAPGAAERFASELRPNIPKGVEALLFPPILGRRVENIAAELTRLLGVACMETLSSAPSA